MTRENLKVQFVRMEYMDKINSKPSIGYCCIMPPASRTYYRISAIDDEGFGSVRFNFDYEYKESYIYCKLYIDRKNKSVNMLSSIPSQTMKKNGRRKRKNKELGITRN